MLNRKNIFIAGTGVVLIGFLIFPNLVKSVTLPGTRVTANLTVTGNITKSSSTFAIDHPLDPKNKLLFHSVVESPDVKNIYDGIVILDVNGEATVELPAYFEALNKDFRYQVKPVTKSSPNLYIKNEVKNNKFTIAGGESGTKVSWQVTGIRHDPYILANPIIPEVRKGRNAPVARGEYLLPELKQADVKTRIPFIEKIIEAFRSLL